MATRAIARRKTRRAKKGMTLPLAIVAPVAYIGSKTIADVQSRGLQGAGELLMARLTGFYPGVDDSFNLKYMRNGLLPLMVGLGVHKVASKLGLNKALGQSGIPFFRI